MLTVEEYEELVHLRGRYIGLCRKIGARTHDDAEDIVQNAYRDAWKYRGTFNHQSATTTWFHKIVKNATFMYYRASQRRARIVTEQPLDEAYHRAWNDDTSLIESEILPAFKTLTPAHRSAIVHKVMGYDRTEGGELSGITKAGEHNRRVYGKRALRKAMDVHRTSSS